MASTQSVGLPSTYRAVVCHEYGQGAKLETLPMPEAVPGSAIVKVLAAACDPGHDETLNSPRHPFFNNPTPFVPGVRAVGRVAALGSDATSLKLGQLVVLEPFVRGRDDPSAQILKGLFGGPSPSAQKLSQEHVWRNGTWAEYTRVPLENCYPLDEKALLGKVEAGGLGYEIIDLPWLANQFVSYGGFRSINLTAGQTIIITPATGNFSGAAVEVASAMGARVIAVGRNTDTLQRLAANIPRVHPVQLTGDLDKDVGVLSQFGPVDAFMDFTPSTMATPLHLKACVSALRPYGKGVLMGFPHREFSLNYGQMILKNITLRAQYMYERNEVADMIKLAERGLLKLGERAGIRTQGQYTLKDWEPAMKKAAEYQAWGRNVVMRPFEA
jgi:D-arabinose 1-dehydrogenase-like Zn-dependent alcohol dehydrogenase